MNGGYRSSELKRAGISPLRVRAVYQELRERELSRRQWKWAVRGAFFAMSGCGTGQRYKATYRHSFSAGDVTNLPALDVLAREMAANFPELDCEDCTERLFELIREPVDRMPPSEATYRKAVDLALSGRFTNSDVAERSVPF